MLYHYQVIITTEQVCTFFIEAENDKEAANLTKAIAKGNAVQPKMSVKENKKATVEYCGGISNPVPVNLED